MINYLYVFGGVTFVITICIYFIANREAKYTPKWWCQKDLKNLKASFNGNPKYLKNYKIVDFWHFPLEHIENELEKVQVLIEKTNKFFLYEALWDKNEYKKNKGKNPIVHSYIKEIPKISLKEWEISKSLGI